jgi:hypothetical protein
MIYLVATAALFTGIVMGWTLSGFNAHRAAWWKENW